MNLIDRFREGVQAVNARDWARHRDLLAPRCRYVDYGAGISTGTADEFIEYQQEGLTPYPDQKITIMSIALNGSTVIAELLTEGTHSGPITLPTGDVLPATGRRVTLHIATVCEYDGSGRCASLRTYYNPVEIAEQIGIAPAIPRQISVVDQPARQR